MKERQSPPVPREGVARRGGGPRVLARLLPKLTRPALKRRSQAEAALLLDWEAIVGPHFARAARPLKLSFPRGEVRREGCLTLAVEPALALELQHLEKLLIERINSHFGFSLLARLKLRQQPLSRPERAQPPAAEAPPDPAVLGALAPRLTEIEDERLRRALAGLGLAVAAEEKT